ncbi:hypothetical protein E2542_SST14163 [Spatholobus suberectus]|nr:hypothetical protein E2542_SST14163 [Spatholobus suberectus]
MAIRKGITLDQLKQTVLSRIRCGDGKKVTDLHYRCPISILTCIELYATITGDEAGASIQPEAVSEDDRNAEIMNEIMEEKTKGFNDTPWWYTLYGSVTSEEWVQYNLSPSQNSR